jgi:hypothetical protein
VTQKVAGDIDKDLMSPEYGFVTDGLMELAGIIFSMNCQLILTLARFKQCAVNQ